MIKLGQALEQILEGHLNLQQQGQSYNHLWI